MAGTSGPVLDIRLVRLGLLIKRAEQALIAEKSRVLREFDLTVPQYATLFILGQTAKASAAQLARACLVTPQTMAAVLGLLEAKGLIIRHASPMHSRLREIKLTRAGIKLVERADKAAVAVEKRLGAAFTPVEFDSFHEYLERAITALSTPLD